MAIPTLRAWTMRRGDLTLAPTASKAGGGVPIATMMLTSPVDSDPITWTVQSGDMTGIALNSVFAPNAIVATANGGFGLHPTDRTLVIRATNSSGFAEANLTIVCVANAYSIANVSDSNSTGLGNATRKLGMGGKTVLMSWGMAVNEPSTSARQDFVGFSTHTGRFSITSEFTDAAANYTVMRTMRITGTSARIDVSKLRFAPYLPATNTSSNAQNQACIATDGACSDITIDDVAGGSPAEAVQVQQWMGGFSFQNATNCVATNMRWSRVKNGVTPGNLTNCTLSGVVVDIYLSGSVFGGGLFLSGNTFSNMILGRCFRNPIDPGDHQDNFQWGVAVSGRDQGYNNNVASNIRMYQVESNAAAQGPFMNDVGFTGTSYSGYGQNNWTLSNIAGDFFKLNPTSDVGVGWQWLRSTYIRPIQSQYVNIARPDINSPGHALGGLYSTKFTSPYDITKTTGVAVGVIAMTVDSYVVSTGQFGNWNANNYTLINNYGPLPATVNDDTQVDADLVAYYVASNAFNDPASILALNFATMTIEQVDTAWNLAFRAKLNGALKNADGTYQGMWFPDGSLNDGTVYQLTPPHSISSNVGVTEAVVGQPITVNFPLDAVANQSVSITVAVAGVTATISPNPLVIGIGETTGSVTVTASTPGTASITCTNNRSLTNPPAIVLPVTSAVTPPTSYTLTLGAAKLLAGQSTSALITLNTIATETVSVTLAGSLSTSFSPNPIVVQFGNLIGVGTVTPHTRGADSISATNDKGLTNPSAAALTVVDWARGSLFNFRGGN